MSERPTIRVFISSPSDVRAERLICERVVKRLDREFSNHIHIEALPWEREPLMATQNFQQQIPPPHTSDIVVVILWSRLGMPLSATEFAGPLSAKQVTGTEWEFEDALKSYRERELPDLLVYRKKATIQASLDDESVVHEQLEQKKLVEGFFQRWFFDPQAKSFTAAFHEFADSAAFEEKLNDHLRALVVRRVGGGGGGEQKASIRYPGNPFRGLLAFEPEDSPIFFGRARATNELRELLARQEAKGQAFVLVMGASGSGKSSLVKAGLLPDLMLPGMIGKVALCRWAVMRPSDGADPLAALAQSFLQPTALPELLALQYEETKLHSRLTSDPQEAAFIVRQGLTRAREKANLPDSVEARLTLVVDQMEELFTEHGMTPETRDAFVRALEALAKSRLVWVIATMRSDFFDRLETLPALVNLSAGEARYLLAAPVPAEIGQIIRQPAREAGLVFEVDPATDLSLDEIIRQATARNPGALPLLSFLLDQLWQRRVEEKGMLTIGAYKELGGLEGALGKRAEEVFLTLPPDVQKELPAVLRALVTIGADGKATARAAELSKFPPGTPERAFIDTFLDRRARLLVADGDSAGGRVRISHEALLSHWDRAREQIEKDARDLELAGRLEQQATRWRAAAKKHRESLLLASGLPLTEALALLKNWRRDLSPQVCEFITRSRASLRRRRIRLAMMIGGAIGSLPVIAAVAWAAMVWSGVRAVEADLEFAGLPAACFDMGSPDGEIGREPNEKQHHVCLQAFEIGKYDITQAQWRRVMVLSADVARFKGDRNPMEMLSWDDANQFITLMNLFGRHHYRLPSESEWENAARGGSKNYTVRFWGDRIEDGCAYANLRDREFAQKYPDEGGTADCDDKFLFTSPVGSFKPNGFGLYDMQGNVFNWVEDCYVADYTKVPKDGTPATAPNCDLRVIRGGAWYTVPNHIRSAYREAYGHLGRGFTGMRLVRIR